MNLNQATIPSLDTVNIAVIGLGYVGLPLAIELGKHFDTVGYDINKSRIAELNDGRDSTREVDADDFEAATRLRFASEPETLATANVYIVTVPTPIDRHKRPDLGALKAASFAGRVALAHRFRRTSWIIEFLRTSRRASRLSRRRSHSRRKLLAPQISCLRHCLTTAKS